MDFNELTNISRAILETKVNVDNIPEDEFDDIVKNCVIDIFTVSSNQNLTSKKHFDLMEKIINGNISKYINQIMSPEGTLAFIPEEFDFNVVEILPENSDDYLDDDYYDDEAPEILKDTSIQLLFDEKDKISKNLKLQSDIIIVNNELIKFLKENPKMLYKLRPEMFEELVAELLSNMGYMIELTKKTRDGGVDIFASKKSGVGETLLIVDCKRYAPHKHIGVNLIRSLYGITEQLKATMGILATTSFFTKPAVEFQSQVRHRISLRDYNDILDWLRSCNLSQL